MGGQSSIATQSSLLGAMPSSARSSILKMVLSIFIPSPVPAIFEIQGRFLSCVLTCGRVLCNGKHGALNHSSRRRSGNAMPADEPALASFPYRDSRSFQPEGNRDDQLRPDRGPGERLQRPNRFEHTLVEEIVTGTMGYPDGFHIAVFQDHEGDGHRTLPAHPSSNIRVFQVLDDQVADIAKIAPPGIVSSLHPHHRAGGAWAAFACSGARDPCCPSRRPSRRPSGASPGAADAISGPAEDADNVGYSTAVAIFFIGISLSVSGFGAEGFVVPGMASSERPLSGLRLCFAWVGERSFIPTRTGPGFPAAPLPPDGPESVRKTVMVSGCFFTLPLGQTIRRAMTVTWNVTETISALPTPLSPACRGFTLLLLLKGTGYPVNAIIITMVKSVRQTGGLRSLDADSGLIAGPQMFPHSSRPVSSGHLSWKPSAKACSTRLRRSQSEDVQPAAGQCGAIYGQPVINP